MTTRTVLNHRLAAVAVALAAVATLVLIAQVAQPTETTAGATIVSPSDGSFDQAEYRRHRWLIEHRTEGFDRAEYDRFERLEPKASIVDRQTGFERAEAERHRRLGAD
ncbi:MAG: hypothetical protein OES24_09440 [Acidimicrobiia bacterium]|nr:hypothetical protein [Acidimicrobiia bacterium]